MKNWVFRGAALAAVICASAAGAQSKTLAEDAAAFGARVSVLEPGLSRDGNSVIYLTPGPGRKTVAVAGDLNSGQFHTLASSDGSPESLDWCSFASTTRAVCRFGGLVPWQGMGYAHQPHQQPGRLGRF